MSAPQISGLAGLFQQPGKGFYKPPAAPAPTATRGWGDQGGNTFLAGMARMSGSTPPAGTPRAPGWGDRGGNAFLTGMKAFPAASPAMPAPPQATRPFGGLMKMFSLGARGY